ncbi:MAG TPA: hypothetical protein VHY30_10380 [Verrucomicrobiae bacterium]|nr:hypothetical protein [Verrucomicrobiae bacterium]
MNLFRRPLWAASTVEDALDVSQRNLAAMIDNDDLSWAWDFSTGRTRKEVRILAHCVVEKAMGPLKEIGATRNLKLPEVVNLILPQKRETLRGAELQRLFHASANLIRDLSTAGEIKRVSEKLPSVGPNASPRFTRQSLVRLLEKRRFA